MRKITIVVGGAGFIGSHLCESLLNDGRNVVCIDNLITGNTGNLQSLDSFSSFDFISVNAQQLDDAVLTKILGKYSIDEIYYLASIASPKLYLRHPMQSIESNISGLLKCIDLAVSHRARFLYTSTSEIYGDPQEHPQKESYTGNVDPVCERSIYDELKRAGETLVMTYNRQGLDTRIVRIFNTFGPHMSDDGRVIPSFINNILNNKPIIIYGDGTQTRSFCYISDLIAGIRLVMSCIDSTPFNIGNPYDYYSILQVADIIQKIMKKDVPIEFRPYFCEGDPKVRCPDISKIYSATQWRPVIDFETGLRHTIGWFRRINDVECAFI